MNKIVTIALLCCAPFSLFSAPGTIHGSANLESQTHDNLTVTNYAVLSGSTIHNTLCVHSSLDARSCTIGTAEIGNYAKLSRSTIKVLSVAGALTAKKCSLNTATVGNYADVTDCTVSEEIQTAGSFKAQACTFLHTIRTGNYAELKDCPQITLVQAQGSVKADTCHIKTIEAGNYATLNNCTNSLITTDGPLKADHCQLSVIETNNYAELYDCKNIESITTNGSLEARDCQAKKAYVESHATLINYVNDEHICIKSSLNATNCTFRQGENEQFSIIAAGYENSLASSIVHGSILLKKPCDQNGSLTINNVNIIVNGQNIAVSQTTSFWSWLFPWISSAQVVTGSSEQKLTIDQNSHVHGDITFEKEGGIVIVKGNSTINGKVINGSIKRE